MNKNQAYSALQRCALEVVGLVDDQSVVLIMSGSLNLLEAAKDIYSAI